MSSPLVLLKPGNVSPPFFITHGLGGNVMELCKVVEGIRTAHPIYGVQWRGLDGEEALDKSVEDMAQYYVTAIIDLQPHGPYLLAGFSFGGLPMLEVAQRLSERGEKVALLAFLDTYPHPQYWPLKCWIGFLAQRFLHHFSVLASLPPRRAITRLRKLYQGFVKHLRSRRSTFPERSREKPSQQLSGERVIKAYAHYRPRHYRGKITFFRPEIATTFPSNPTAVWGKLISQLEIHNMPGNHMGLVSTHAEAVAAALSFCLEKALAPKIQTYKLPSEVLNLDSA